LTLANKITISRILLIPLFVVLVVYYQRTGEQALRWTALAVFLTASISDAIDGWIARRFQQLSQLGATLDPLADKLLLVSALILLSRQGIPHLPPLPLWLVATVLSRDALLILGCIVIHLTCGHVVVRPRFISKTGTVLQMAAVVLALADVWPALRGWCAFAAALTTGASTILYVRDGVAQLSRHPTSGPVTAARTPPSPPSSGP
jgi:CDP-diacylglycerol--glycerol-3-phosphate 3-phosphatidyltransferase